MYIRNKYVSKDTLVFTSQDDIIWIKIDKSLCCFDRIYSLACVM